MTETTGKNEVERLRWEIDTLKGQVSKLTRERDEAVYKKEIAEWAVVGIVASRVHFQLTQSATSFDAVNDAFRVSQALGRQAAHALLHHAGLAFEAHADFFELRQHVHYLENHARASGLAFKPWAETVATGGAFKYTRYAAHPFPKAFGSPEGG